MADVNLDSCGLMVDASVDLDALKRGCHCKQPVRVGWYTDMSYNDLRDKPTLNGVTIQGAKTASDYGLANKTDIMPTVNAEFEDVETVPERFNLPMLQGKINEVLGILKGTAAVAIVAVASALSPMNAPAAGVYTTVVSNLWNDSIVVTNVDIGEIGTVTDVKTNGVSVLSGSVAELNGLASTNYVNDLVSKSTSTNTVNDLIRFYDETNLTERINAKVSTNDFIAATNGLAATLATNSTTIVSITNTLASHTTQLSQLSQQTDTWNTVTNKQDKLPYPTNAIPWIAITNVPSLSWSNDYRRIDANINWGDVTNHEDFVTKSITNGLASTNYVKALVYNATNGYVTASITNGLATTNYVNDKIGDIKADRITSTTNTIFATGDWVTRTNETLGIAVTNRIATETWVANKNYQTKIDDYTTTNVVYSIVSNAVPIRYVYALPEPSSACTGLIYQIISTTSSSTAKFYKCWTNNLYGSYYTFESSSLVGGRGFIPYKPVGQNYVEVYSDCEFWDKAHMIGKEEYDVQMLKVYANDSYAIYDTSSSPSLAYVEGSSIEKVVVPHYIWYEIELQDLSGYQLTSERTDEKWSEGGSSSQYPTTKAVSLYTTDLISDLAKAEDVTNLVKSATNDLSKTVVNYDYDMVSNRTAVTIGNRGYYMRPEQIQYLTGTNSFANGCFVIAKGAYSHAEGNNTHAYGDYSHAEGYGTYAYGDYSHAEGYGTYAYGDYSHAEGYRAYTSDKHGTKANYAFSWNGDNSKVAPYYSNGEGTFNINPKGGTSGFWIGETNFHDHVKNITDGIVSSSNLASVAYVGGEFLSIHGGTATRASGSDNGVSYTLQGGRYIPASEGAGVGGAGASLSIGGGGDTDVGTGGTGASLTLSRGGNGDFLSGTAPLYNSAKLEIGGHGESVYSEIQANGSLTIQHTGTSSETLTERIVRDAAVSESISATTEYLTNDYIRAENAAFSNEVVKAAGSRVTLPTYDFQSGTNFTLRLYAVLTNIIDRMGGSITNAPSFD